MKKTAATILSILISLSACSHKKSMPEEEIYAHFKNLEGIDTWQADDEIHISSSAIITIKEIDMLTQLKSLDELRFRTKKYDLDDYTFLAELKNLKKLDLTLSSIDDDDLAVLQKLPKLEELTLRSTAITDKGISSIISLPITYLKLDDTNITDEGVKMISSMTQLKYLNLSNTKITDEGMEYISKLTNLKELVIAGNDISDKGVERIKYLNLNVLTLSGCNITDAALPYLYDMDFNNGFAGFTETQVTTEGASELMDRYEMLNVYWGKRPEEPR